MEHTKAWVVSRAISGMFMGSTPSVVFFSKQEAEFYKWKKNQEECSVYSFMSHYYHIDEVQVATQDKNSKDFKKFCSEKMKEIDKQIADKNTHSEEDLAEVARLKKEKEEYLTTPTKN